MNSIIWKFSDFSCRFLVHFPFYSSMLIMCYLAFNLSFLVVNHNASSNTIQQLILFSNSTCISTTRDVPVNCSVILICICICLCLQFIIYSQLFSNIDLCKQHIKIFLALSSQSEFSCKYKSLLASTKNCV